MKQILLGLLGLSMACGQPNIAAQVPSSTTETPLAVNDVSWLFPIDTSAPALEAFLTNQQRSAARFSEAGTARITSVRIDPCFPVAPEHCQHQVRLVAQFFDETGIAQDSAIHLFFVFTDDEWQAVRAGVRSLAALSGTRTQGVPLGVHPVLQQEGLGGPWGREMVALITAQCTAARLHEVAVMSATGTNWTFYRFAVSGSVLSPLDTTGGGHFSLAPQTDVVLTRQSYGVPGAEVEPEGLLSGSGALVSTVLENLAASRNHSADLREAIAMLENPLETPTPSIDCGVCHRATQLRFDHDQRRGLTPLAPRFPTAAVTQSAPEVTRNNFHAFSYDGDRPTVTDRTVYESVLAAQRL